MNDEVDKDKPEDEADNAAEETAADAEESRAGEGAEAEESGPLCGERLAVARREQQITILEVAKELHLDEAKVRALESNNFDNLGAPVFAKGHLKKYASLVGVDADDVLQDYYQLNRSSGMPPVVGKVRKPARELSPGPWIAAALVIILAAAAYWWFVVAGNTPGGLLQPSEPDIAEPGPVESSTVASTVVPPPVGNAAPEAVDTAAETLTAEVEAASPPDETASQEAPVSEPDPAPATSSAVAAGEVQLAMQFSGDCWTEVSDADGRRLFFGLGRDGRSVDVSGRAPLSALFGNADNVSLQVNGSDYSIAAADRRGDTARLTLQAP